MNDYEREKPIQSGNSDKTAAENVGRTLGQQGIPLPDKLTVPLPVQENIQRGYNDAK
jgi:hypothetical protein